MKSIKSRRNNKTMKILIAILSILTIGGIGFSGWQYAENTKLTKEVSEKEAVVQSQKEELDKLQVKPDENATENEATEVEPLNTTDEYIYVASWGVKIKIPEEERDKIGYTFRGDNLKVLDNTTTETDNNDYVVYSIYRSEKGTNFNGCQVNCPVLSATVGDYDYGVLYPQTPSETGAGSFVKQRGSREILPL